MPRTTSSAPAAFSPNKHQARTEATKKKLIEAAYEIFTRDGFVGARIEDIAAHAGFTRGAFYAHFQSKNDLFFGLMEAKAEQKHERLRHRIERRKTSEQRLATFREFYVASSTDRQWVMLLIEFKLYAIRQPKLHRQLAEAHRNLRERVSSWMLEAGVEGLGESLAHSEDLRAALEGAYLGLVLERAYDPKRLPDARMRAFLGRVFDSVTA